MTTRLLAAFPPVRLPKAALEIVSFKAVFALVTDCPTKVVIPQSLKSSFSEDGQVIDWITPVVDVRRSLNWVNPAIVESFPI
jgi:hypothetical protein